MNIGWKDAARKNTYFTRHHDMKSMVNLAKLKLIKWENNSVFLSKI